MGIGILFPPEVSVFIFPVSGEAQGFSGGHFHEGELLAAGDEDGLVGRANDLKGTPEPNALDRIEASLDPEMVAEPGGTPVIDFGSKDDRVLLAIGHFPHRKADFCTETGSRGFNEPEVGNIVNDRTTIRVKEHDLFFGLNSWCFGHRGNDATERPVLQAS